MGKGSQRAALVRSFRRIASGHRVKTKKLSATAHLNGGSNHRFKAGHGFLGLMARAIGSGRQGPSAFKSSRAAPLKARRHAIRDAVKKVSAQKENSATIISAVDPIPAATTSTVNRRSSCAMNLR
jgi:hypothetical protein